jgi:hypothetical protein
MQSLSCARYTYIQQAVYIIGVLGVVFSELRTEVRKQQNIIRLTALRSVDRGQLYRCSIRELSAAF